ncbi:MAG: hypothetical protein K0Q72_3313 [Armatimonadetes bacterium]|jgi:hypothetical protein|nr:hypothetical protein [Armatimonadota bacterium]
MSQSNLTPAEAGLRLVLLAIVLIAGVVGSLIFMVKSPEIGTNLAYMAKGVLPPMPDPNYRSGPRERMLNEAVYDCQRRGELGQAVLNDSAVQAQLSHARKICRDNDRMFGETAPEPASMDAIGRVYDAMASKLDRSFSLGR